ncbi:MAG TPA: APC family permease [Candidatus Deferrimicrobiaceae bacterium]|jgi:amino acid transporter
MTDSGPPEISTLGGRLRRTLFGAPKKVDDPSIFHKLSLVPLLAWIGLGADGLSSSAYGPEEAFRALGGHTYLALLLGLATALTVFIISYAYSRIIEHFPYGGGGYIVATHMLGDKAGVVSGSALLVDYILTITVSIVACADALFSFLPIHYQVYKVPFSAMLILLLIVLNIRGVKESITIMAPIFMVFFFTHLFLLGYGIFGNLHHVAPAVQAFQFNFARDISSIGGIAMVLMVLHAYSLGGGTYTGIEAVSNGLQIMREPHVKTGKRTMVYMATSLAITAGGLFFCYILVGAKPEEGRTLNAVLADMLYGHWSFGPALALVTIFSEGALLLLAAQAGFIDGPRVMANMAVDSWLPHRFSALSERLTMQNGVVLMGLSAMALLFYTKGSISALIVMYSINVFLTFSLSEFGMARFFITHRKTEKEWKQHLAVHATGLTLCLTILVITTIEKFREGGWITLVITSCVIGLCYWIRGHYGAVREEMKHLDEMLTNLPLSEHANEAATDRREMTAVILVNQYNGFGIHTVLSIVRNYKRFYKNFVFLSVAVVDSGSFKGAAEIEALKDSVQTSLDLYVKLAQRLGFAAEGRMTIGTEVVSAATQLCQEVAKAFPQSMFFTGQLTFRLEKFYHRILHNETAFAIQRRLHWYNIPTVILPIRMDA